MLHLCDRIIRIGDRIFFVIFGIVKQPKTIKIMLHFNFTRILKMRAIDKPYSFLVKNGFSHNLAHRIGKDKLNNCSMPHLEKICKLLNCTPNDLIEWVPDNETDNQKCTALQSLKKENKFPNIEDITRSIPLDELSILKELIDARKKKS